MKFSVVNLGCKVNRVESDEAAALLMTYGEPADIQDADLVLINTCTVTGTAEKKTRKSVRHVLRENQRCEVLVTGCAAAINPQFYEGLSKRVSVVLKNELLQFLEDKFGASTGKNHALRSGSHFNTRVGIKIQDGCKNACTYCIVHTARGKPYSKPARQVLDECLASTKNGTKEFVLTGINLGSYSCDDTGESLSGLLSSLLSETKAVNPSGIPPRFRLSSIEPNDIADELIELIARSDGRICRHLHLPLQSGSSKVLREMARHYSADDYLELVSALRDTIPVLALTTDIIVGFPGESDKDFEETLSLARACAFSKIHVFPYSKREGTPAAARTDQVPNEVKSERAAKLRRLSDELRQTDYNSRVGRREYVLVEQCDRAMSESYYEIECNMSAESAISQGDLIEIELLPANVLT